MSAGALADRLVARIREQGPLRFDEYVDAALYDADAGFYATNGGAGRGRDFLTSPEVGPLFGAVMANAIDAWWDEAGRPGAWTVVDAGAGPGTLLRSVLAAEPACAPALRPVAVDPTAPSGVPEVERIVSRRDLPDEPITGVVIANELLDNLPWRVLQRVEGGWCEVLVGVDVEGRLAEQLGPVLERPPPVVDLAPAVAVGRRIPWQQAAAGWVRDVLGRLRRGRLLVVDYATPTAEMAGRDPSEWMRTYRGHRRGGPPLDRPGAQDITVEVAVDQLTGVRPPTRRRSQADFLRAHGLDDLVEAGRRVWAERAHLGDLEAIRARSRIGEADALTDADGLGGFEVVEWRIG